MVDALKPLAGKSRMKRQLDDESNEADDEVVNNVKKDVDSITKSITLPLGGKGTSAFSVHARTVYILYPSLFQDPNIFGRFSIPQNINMDKNSPGNAPSVSGRRSSPDIIKPYSNQNQIFPSQRGKRSADQNDGETTTPPPQNPPQQAPLEKRNVQTHLTGTIVVQNQDVNEFNRRETY